MAHKSLLLIFLLNAILVFGQESSIDYEEKYNSKDSTSIEMYKIFTVDRDSTYLDTTLTIQKEYKMNFLRKDYFELLTFSNTGHAFNRLGYNFSENPLLQGIGARSKHFAYKEASDILYYRVPTPLTELFFKTTFEQGRMAESLIAINLSPHFNFALSYRGTRSLGKYVNLRSSNTRFVLSLNYKTSNSRYFFLGHYAKQFIENQENGGIDDNSKLLFESGNEDYLDRSLFNLRLNQAENTLDGKRYFFDHYINIISPKKDSAKVKFLIGHRFLDEIRHYGYKDFTAPNHFGSLVEGQTAIVDLAQLERTENQFYTEFNTLLTGKLRMGVAIVQSHYFLSLEEEEKISEDLNPNEIKTDQLLLKGSWKFYWRGFSIHANLQKTMSGSVLSDEVVVETKYKLPNKITFIAKASIRNQLPDFNFQLYKSDYANYNWYNPDLKNQKTNHFSFDFEHPKFGGIYVQWEQLTNYTYYNTTSFLPREEDSNVDTTSTLYPSSDIYLVAPSQAVEPLNYFKIRYTSHYTFGKFAIINTAQYQKVTGASIENSNNIVSKPLNVPEWNFRTTFSYSRNIFKKAMFLQTGITTHYFTKYYADRYNPLLADFTRQGDVLVGNFPRLDFFVNGKIQRTRIYFKLEHFNSSITGYNYYSAPSYPYRDFVIRFGVVWNFFQ